MVKERSYVLLADCPHRGDLDETPLLQIAAGAADGVTPGVAASNEALAALVRRGSKGRDDRGSAVLVGERGKTDLAKSRADVRRELTVALVARMGLLGCRERLQRGLQRQQR